MSKQVILLFMLAVSTVWGQKFVSKDYDAKPVMPILGDSLRHPNIFAASNGNYYLTGTTGSNNWAYDNKEIKLWESTDLKNWKFSGTIWSIAQHNVFNMPATGLPNTFHSNKALAFRSPEVCEIKGDYYLVYSMTNEGICIAKSTTKTAKGPYKPGAILSTYGYDPSLFCDDDGKTYLIFNGGFLAALNDSLTALAEQPKYIFPQIEPSKGWGLKSPMDRIGTSGAHIFKKDGAYHIAASDKNWRMATFTYDMFVAKSEGTIYGPYNRRYLAIPHAYNGNIFADNQGNWWASYCGHPNDPYTFFNNQTGLVPLVNLPNSKTLSPSSKIILEKGAIGSSHPVRDLENQFSRDPSICIGHDGYYYMVCTIEKESLAPDGGIKMWRSNDLQKWEYLGLVWTWKNDAPEWLTNRKLNDRFWAPEISFINGRYYIAVSLSQMPRGIMLLQSPLNNPTGKYTDPVGKQIADGIDGFLYQDTDKTVYFLWANGRIAKMKKDMSGFAEEPWHIVDKNKTLLGYEGIGIFKHNGTYFIHAADHSGDENGSYDFTYVTAKNIRGPYSERVVTMPHVGHTTVFKGKDKSWYCTQFGSTGTHAFHQRFGILKIEIDKNNHIIPLATPVGY